MDWWDFLAQQPEDGGCVLDAATFAAQRLNSQAGGFSPVRWNDGLERT